MEAIGGGLGAAYGSPEESLLPRTKRRNEINVEYEELGRKGGEKERKKCNIGDERGEWTQFGSVSQGW